MKSFSDRYETFRFPNEEELDDFSRPQTKKEILSVMNSLKYSTQHYSKKVKFIYSALAPANPHKKPRKQQVFKFYFNCCSLKPRIVFIEDTPDYFVLDPLNSSFIHEHEIPSFKEELRAPYGSKKHWKTIQKEKRYMPAQQSLENYDQVKIQESEYLPAALKNYQIHEENPQGHKKTDFETYNSLISLKELAPNEYFPRSQDESQRPTEPKRGRINFSTRGKSSEISPQASPSPSFQKKIFKSKMFFNKKDSLADRPWIFKSTTKPNWLKKCYPEIQNTSPGQRQERKETIQEFQVEENPKQSFPISEEHVFWNPQKTPRSNIEQSQQKIKSHQKQKQNSPSLPIEKAFESANLEEKKVAQKIKKADFGLTDISDQNISNFSEPQNIGLQDPTVSMSKAIYTIFQWYKQYTEKIFDRKLTKPMQKLDFTQIIKNLNIEKPFLVNYNQPKQTCQKFARFWEESNNLLLKTNNFFELDFKQPEKNIESDSTGKIKFCNKIFISKKAQNLATQSTGKAFSDTIYLGMYPIKFTNRENLNDELIIAYKISTKLEAKLMWFCILEEPSIGDSKEREKFMIKSIMDCLLKSIDFMKLRKVSFLYTTLKKRLVWGLCNAMKIYNLTKLPNGFSFSMHASCIDKLIYLEKSRKEKFIEFLSSIRPSGTSNIFESEKVDASKEYFKGILKKRMINPRQFYENFKYIRVDFHTTPSLGKTESLDLSFLSSEFYSEKEFFQTKDPIFEANEILGSMNKFSGFEEFFPLILTIFNTNFYKGLRIVDDHMIVPSNFMWKEHELLVCNKIFNSEEKNDFRIEEMFRKLFKSAVLDLESVVKNCPRILTQTVYRLINFSSLLSITHQKDYIIKEDIKSKLESFKVINSEKNLEVNVFSTEKLETACKERTHSEESLIFDFLRNSIVQEASEKKECEKTGVKEWNCECRFFHSTGIPCEHEICCAVTFKTSVYNEIHNKWK